MDVRVQVPAQAPSENHHWLMNRDKVVRSPSRQYTDETLMRGGAVW